MSRIDDIDAQILTLLQKNGRIKRRQIAEEVGLSLPSVSERMRKLEERGVIDGIHANLNAKRLQLDITAFIRVMVDRSNDYTDFVDSVRDLTEVLEIHSITGDGSHMLKVRTKNTTTLEKLLAQIQSYPGVRGSKSSIVLSTYKETRHLDVKPTTIYFGDNEVTS